MHLRSAEHLFHLPLLLSFQGSIGALIEPPAGQQGNPHPIHLFQHNPRRPDGSLQNRGEGYIEIKAAVLHQPSGTRRLLPASEREINIHPSGEPSFLVEEALAVPEQD